MYAEINFYDDDGTIKNRRPYLVPANKIDVLPLEVDGAKTIEYKFTVAFAERIPTNPREIEMLDRMEKAYKQGYNEGAESVERYYAGGRF